MKTGFFFVVEVLRSKISESPADNQEPSVILGSSLKPYCENELDLYNQLSGFYLKVLKGIKAAFAVLNATPTSLKEHKKTHPRMRAGFLLCNPIYYLLFLIICSAAFQLRCFHLHLSSHHWKLTSFFLAFGLHLTYRFCS